MQRRHFLRTGIGCNALAARGALGGLLALPAAFPVARAASALRVGVLIPLSGPAALFGPSSRSCAELAAAEINARGGLAGREIQLVFGDAGGAPDEAARIATGLWRSEGAEAFVGMHDSAVRAALVRLFDGALPYIYTPTYEGGGCAQGTLYLGETPAQQLGPVIPWLAAQRGLKRWYLIGNDYAWPRETNLAAKRFIAASKGSVVGEEYVGFSTENFDDALAAIKSSRADAVLITLVGGASVAFNRSFAAHGMAAKTARLGTLIEENTLSAIGAPAAANLYASSGYFASLRTPLARAFGERYATRFGREAPPLNVLAQSCYEGLLLLEALVRRTGSLRAAVLDKASEWLLFDGPRGTTVMRGRHAIRDIYLAQAEGSAFKVIKTFEAVDPAQACRVKLAA
jgi:urea transport system substrate-binding protein